MGLTRQLRRRSIARAGGNSRRQFAAFGHQKAGGGRRRHGHIELRDVDEINKDVEEGKEQLSSPDAAVARVYLRGSLCAANAEVVSIYNL